MTDRVPYHQLLSEHQAMWMALRAIADGQIARNPERLAAMALNVIPFRESPTETTETT